MTQIGTSAEGRFWLKWVIGNTLGSVFGLFMAYSVTPVFYVLGLMISQAEFHTSVEAMFLPVALGMIFAVYGFLLGLGQWVILNLRVPTTRYWYWLSSLGWGILGCFSGLGIYPEWSVITAIVFGGSSGFVLGLLQWTVLCRMTTSARWWLGISAIGYAIGYTLPAWINLREIAAGDISGFLAIALGQISISAITGLGLIWILKPSSSSRSVAA